MPDGITHETFRRAGRFIFIPASILIPMFLPIESMNLIDSTSFGAGIFIGYEMGRYVGCDADIMGTTSSEGWLVNEIPFFGHFIFGILSIYGSIFRKYHRSFITHFPFVSTFIRHLFLFLWFWIELYRASSNWDWLRFVFLGMFIGNSFSDASIHPSSIEKTFIIGCTYCELVGNAAGLTAIEPCTRYVPFAGAAINLAFALMVVPPS